MVGVGRDRSDGIFRAILGKIIVTEYSHGKSLGSHEFVVELIKFSAMEYLSNNNNQFKFL